MTITPIQVESEVVALGTERILLRRIHGHLEYLACEELQRRIWGEGDIARVPLLDMVTAQENGGFVLGAFHGDELAGFVFSFPGITADGEVKQCSVLAAVAPEFQNLGLGYQLKQYQARLAARHGFRLITWTFDPLSGRNVVFNLNKLGAVGIDYVENAYGVGMGLNAGLETDRLLVAWHVPPVPRQRDQGGGTPVNDIRFDRGGLPVPAWSTKDCDDRTVLLKVPWDVYAISARDRELAMAWRHESRALLGGYLARGYRAVGLRLHERGAPPTYVLERSRS
ncbi:hypothetical protein Lesp02_73730 [Lentzea sp. NBRC 105346]|uniref:GNAT family N-acetyltransferase n=1 Tax=Lentzea sp. NBRC 105346 TaxID=3032205 RepID=UPI0024A605C6|nr:GNAT family N-acetyltransferase [Lentzea sp. NBRC 105346]GLZ35186.1 hypothetical protein Lesp02_73730 [Lentzea sp. NBRC 105346]